MIKQKVIFHDHLFIFIKTLKPRPLDVVRGICYAF